MKYYILWCSIVIALCDVIQISLISPILFHFLSQDKSNNNGQWFNISSSNSLLILLFIIFMTLLARVLSIYFINKVNERFRSSISHHILNTYLKLPYLNKNKFSQSSAASFVLTDTDNFIVHTVRPLTLAMSSILISSGIFVYLLFSYTISTIYITFGVGLIYLMMQLTINQYVDRYGKLSFSKGEKRFQHANESLSLYHDIKAYRMKMFFLANI